MAHFKQTYPPGSEGKVSFSWPGGFFVFKQPQRGSYSPGLGETSLPHDRVEVLSWDVLAAALLRRERKSFGFRRAYGEERRKLVARPIFHARVVFHIFALFHASFLVRARRGHGRGAAPAPRQGT